MQSAQNIRKILVAKLRHHGDVLLSSPVFSLLKKTYPKAHIDAYIYKETHPMLDGHPAIDGFVLYDKKQAKKGKVSKIKHEFSNLKKIRKSSYDLVINLTEGDRGAIAALVSKAKYRVGFDPEKSGFFAKKRIYTHTARICHGFRHTVERHLDVLRCFDIFAQNSDKKLTLDIKSSVLEKLIALLELHQINVDNFVLVHPVSRWLFKCWEEEKVARVINHLTQKGFHIVLSAAPDPEEIAMNKRILTMVDDRSHVLDLSGKISLKELGGLIKLSKLLFCVDSVPMHMASALKAPVVALFGPTSEKTWAPWQNPFSEVVVDQTYPCRPCFMPGCGGSGKSECILSLKVEEVLRSIENVFERAYPLDALYQLSKAKN